MRLVLQGRDIGDDRIHLFGRRDELRHVRVTRIDPAVGESLLQRVHRKHLRQFAERRSSLVRAGVGFAHRMALAAIDLDQLPALASIPSPAEPTPGTAGTNKSIDAPSIAAATNLFRRVHLIMLPPPSLRARCATTFSIIRMPASWPSVMIDSGWNCTAATGSLSCSIAITTPSSVSAVTRNSFGNVA
jgi:hypothetical protein